MRIGAPSNTAIIMCKDQPLERATTFKYLGSIVTTTGGSEEDVEVRCRKAQAVFYMLRPVWKSKYISLRTQLKQAFNSNVKSVLLYGSESWRFTSNVTKKLQSFVNRRLRFILGIFWPNKISNEELWKRTEQEEIAVTIRRRKRRWIGHIGLEPPREKEKWATKKILEEDSYRRTPTCGHVVGTAKTDIQEPSPLENSCGGTMLR